MHVNTVAYKDVGTPVIFKGSIEHLPDVLILLFNQTMCNFQKHS